MATNPFGIPGRVRRSVFVSYHHGGDQPYYDAFSRAFDDQLKLLTDRSLERKVDSADVDYVMRRIREHHLLGSSCTIVLCGLDTWRRKYVDWEILASLNQEMGLVGVRLPTLPILANGGTEKPGRLQDNIDNEYAVWIGWDDLSRDHWVLIDAIETAVGRPKSRIVNYRARMLRNG